MTTWLRNSLKALFVILGISVAGAAVFYWQVVQPLRQHSRLLTVSLPGKKVDPNELRQVAHRCLRWTSSHDAFLSLVAVGDQTSIPVLIRSLARVEKPNKDGVVVCTSAHCLQALRTVTGEDFGYDVAAWERWYKTRSATSAGNPHSGGVAARHPSPRL